MWETALAKIEAGSMDATRSERASRCTAPKIILQTLLCRTTPTRDSETCPCPQMLRGRILVLPESRRSVPRGHARLPNIRATSATRQLSDKQIVRAGELNPHRPANQGLSRARHTAQAPMLRWVLDDAVQCRFFISPTNESDTEEIAYLCR